MTTTINDYTQLMKRLGKNWIDDYYQDYDDFDDLWFDMSMDITGNDGSHPEEYDRQMARDIVWDNYFIEYCHEMCTDVGTLMEKGEDYIDVYARYCALDYFCNSDLSSYWEDKQGEEE